MYNIEIVLRVTEFVPCCGCFIYIIECTAVSRVIAYHMYINIYVLRCLPLSRQVGMDGGMHE